MDPPGSGSRRINPAQSFNGLGCIQGPLVGWIFIFFGEGDPFSAFAKTYTSIGVVVLIITALFIKTPLPQISADDSEASAHGHSTPSTGKSDYIDRSIVYICRYSSVF